MVTLICLFIPIINLFAWQNSVEFFFFCYCILFSKKGNGETTATGVGFFFLLSLLQI